MILYESAFHRWGYSTRKDTLREGCVCFGSWLCGFYSPRRGKVIVAGGCAERHALCKDRKKEAGRGCMEAVDDARAGVSVLEKGLTGCEDLP